MHRVPFMFAVCLCLVLTAIAWAQPDAVTVPPDRAMLIVRVPARAVLTVSGQPTSQTGAERIFTTPRLEPGATYSYEFVARWNASGNELVTKRIITFHAGQARVVDLGRSQEQPQEPRMK